MKRSPFRPRVEPILRRSRMKRNPPRRRAREAVFDPYVAWLHSGGNCVVCGTTQNIQGSHVGSGGTGQKRGRACDMVRMCGPGGNDCHSQWEQRRLYFSLTNAWDAQRRATAARQWRLKSWNDYILAAPVEDLECLTAIATCIDNFEHGQEQAA